MKYEDDESIQHWSVCEKMTGGIKNQKNLSSPDKNIKKRDLSFAVISSPTR